MKLCQFITPIVCACALGAAGRLRADDMSPTGTDPDLPQSFDASTLSALAEQSPFNRIVSLEDTFLLTGVAYFEGKPFATVMNKDTKQRFVVGQEPNALGWHLAEASPSSDPRDTEVRLVLGSEEVALHYTDVLKTPSKKSSSSSSSSGSRHREVTPVDIHKLSESDYLRKDKDGKTYIRGSIYLPTEDRDKYYNSMTSAARDRFRQIVEDGRDKMKAYSPDQRAAFAKKAFDKAEAEDRAGKLK